MGASNLPLPRGLDHALYVDGMRECMQYIIELDAFRYQWDTEINGKKCRAQADDKRDGSFNLEVTRADIKRHFEKIESNGRNQL